MCLIISKVILFSSLIGYIVLGEDGLFYRQNFLLRSACLSTRLSGRDFAVAGKFKQHAVIL